MFRFIRYIALSFIACALLLWASLFTDPVQKYLKETVSQLALEKANLNVDIGHFHGLPPFWFGTSGIVISEGEKKIASIDSLDLVPSWAELIFGKIALLYLSLDKVTIHEIPELKQNSGSNSDFDSSIAVHACTISNLKIPYRYYEPLLKSRYDKPGSLVDLSINVKGSLSFKPKDQEFSLSLKLKPQAGDDAPFKLKGEIKKTKELTEMYASFDCGKTDVGSVFITLPVDDARAYIHLKAKSDELQRALADSSSKFEAPIISGNWHAKGLWAENSRKPFSPIVRFQVGGNLAFSGLDHLQFAADALNIEKIEPFLSERSSAADYAIADSEEVIDYSNISTVVKLKTSDSITGRLYKDTSRDNDTYLVDLTSPAIDFDTHKFANCRLAMAATPDEKGLNGSIALDATIERDALNFPLSFYCDYSTQGASSLQIPEVRLKLLDHELTGKFDCSFYPTAITGHLASVSQDLGNVARHLGFDSARGFLLLQLEPHDSSQNAKLMLQIEDLASKTLFCQKGSLSIDGHDLFANPVVDISFRSKNLQTNHASWDKIKGDTQLDFKLATFPYRISFQGASKNGPCRIGCDGTYSTTALHVDGFELEASGKMLRTSAPVEIAILPSKITISPFEIQTEKGSCATLQAFITREKISSGITLSEFPVECLDAFLGDLTLYGPLSGHMNLTGSAKSPKIDINLASGELSFWDPKFTHAPPLTTSLQIEVDAGNCQSLFELQGLSVKKPTLFEARFPLHLSFYPFNFQIPEMGKIDGAFQAEFDLNTLLTSYLDEDDVIEGIVSFDAKIEGNCRAPHIDGQFFWNDGLIQLPTGGQIRNIQMQGSIQDRKISIDSIQAKDDDNGTLNGKGYLIKPEGKSPQYHFDLTSDNFSFINLDEVSIQTSGQVSLAGNFEEAELTGAIELPHADVRLSTGISKELPKLDITYVNADETKKLQKVPFLFGFNLDCNLPHCHVHGMGLESVWKGRAHLSGKNNTIDLNGKAALESGTVAFAGRTFSLSDGSIDFKGDLYKKSRIYVTASDEIGSTTAQVILQGTLEAPKIVLRSNPSMSQKEILSLILFNKCSSDITPFQGLQLGQILLQMNGSADSLDILGQVKQTLHIDRLDIGEGSHIGPQTSPNAGSSLQLPTQTQDGIPNETAVQVGKYISDGVMVTLSKDVTNEVNRVGVEAQLTPHISVEANVGDDSQAELFLEWKHKY